MAQRTSLLLLPLPLLLLLLSLTPTSLAKGNTCTYTFTVENADARCVSRSSSEQLTTHNKASLNQVGYDGGYAPLIKDHPGGGGSGGSSRRRGHYPRRHTQEERMSADQVSQREVLTKLLLTVNKLLQHQNVLENIKLAHKGISDLKDEMHGQHEEYAGMAGRLQDLEAQLQLLTSGRTLQEDGRRSEVFKDFTGQTSRFLGCPEKSARRVHQMAPIKKRFEELIRAVPRSCTEWRQGGFTNKGLYLIDPDGMEDTPAFAVICHMDLEEAPAVVHHTQEARAHVVGHDPPGSYNVEVKYHGVDWDQLSALTAYSYRCEQYLRWECKGAAISRESWWVDRHGEAIMFWGGGKGRGCACLLNDTCQGGNLCNCDVNKDTEWLSDEGVIYQKEHLPVRRLQLGDTGGKHEEGYYTLGPLICYSNKTNPYGSSNAFMPVEIYKPFNVFCDLEGWLVISRHTAPPAPGSANAGSSPSISFHRSWGEYRDGFGEMEGDFWLGLERVHYITTQGKDYTLQVVFTNKEGLHYYAQYSHFHVSNEVDGFRLYIGHFTGTSIDALSPAYGQLFSTKDRDNDLWGSGNCAEHATKPPPGGWWYTDCGKVFIHGAKLTWGGIDDIQRVEMKIKPST